MQDGEQQVLFVYFISSLYSGLKHSQLQDVAGLLIEHKFCGVYGHVDLVFPHTLFQFVLHRLQVQIQPAEKVYHGSSIASEHTQQQVFGAYAPTGQTGSLLARESENFRDFW